MWEVFLNGFINRVKFHFQFVCVSVCEAAGVCLVTNVSDGNLTAIEFQISILQIPKIAFNVNLNNPMLEFVNFGLFEHPYLVGFTGNTIFTQNTFVKV